MELELEPLRLPSDQERPIVIRTMFCRNRGTSYDNRQAVG